MEPMELHISDPAVMWTESGVPTPGSSNPWPSMTFSARSSAKLAMTAVG